VQIPLYKLFLVLAAYALAFGVFRPLEAAGVYFGIVMGSAWSAVILLSRPEEQRQIVAVTVGGLLGGTLGCFLLGPELMTMKYGYDHGFGETENCMMAAGVLGVVAGGFVAAILVRSRKVK